ncbi:long-chain-fatty-acid--coa ligase [Anaeramoeba flamelloides]|uniref:Long-chain-fatty-acid--coa ligase n=1 Tax=Anaeramoeba flamelloides TaxID=1746091 RepID=A0AAV7ZUG7_9EUKA|nr:long-chain-fatty-acid--coa ligase [Anaeramoeba flamelloides]
MSKKKQKLGYFLEGEKEGEKICRNIMVKDKDLLKGYPKIDTLHHLFEVSAKKFAEKPFLGERSKTLENGKVKYSKYQWISYKAFQPRKNQFGAALVKTGLKEGDSLGIWGPNNIHWKLAEYACYSFGFVVVSLYDTLGPESSVHILNHSNIKMVVCDKNKIEKIIGMKEDCPALERIICMDSDYDRELKKTAKKKGIKIITCSQMLTVGKKNFDEDQIVVPKPDSIATIMYTSGTTGLPKGVLLTHQNILAAAAGADFGSGFISKPDDSFISFLPLAHIFERELHTWLIYHGSRIGFYSGNIRLLVNDISELKPSLMVGVPRVFSRIYDKVLDTIEKKGGISKWMFNKGYKSKTEALTKDKDTFFWNSLVFKKTKKRLGGRVRMVLSGSAPLSKEHHNFLRVCFTPHVVQGYGLTETAAAGAIGNLYNVVLDAVGAPKPCTEVKLVDVPEMEYYAKEDQGEIWLRGYSVFKGYYKDEEKTKESITEDGWFKTGDIGRFNKNGTLSIIDRKKNIVKLAQGEYISVESLENIFSQHKNTAQVWVFGSSFESYPISVIVPDFESLEIKDDDEKEEYCKNEDNIKRFEKEIRELALKNKLKGFEIPKKIYLEHVPFTIESNLLTDTQKLKRFQLTKKYEQIIEELYRQLNKDLKELQKKREQEQEENEKKGKGNGKKEKKKEIAKEKKNKKEKKEKEEKKEKKEKKENEEKEEKKEKKKKKEKKEKKENETEKEKEKTEDEKEKSDDEKKESEDEKSEKEKSDKSDLDSSSSEK